MADGGEDHVGGIAGAALEVAAAEVPVGLHVTDHGLDGRSASDRRRIDHMAFDALTLKGE